jgi:hypothetical protein
VVSGAVLAGSAIIFVFTAVAIKLAFLTSCVAVEPFCAVCIAAAFSAYIRKANVVLAGFVCVAIIIIVAFSVIKNAG